MTDIPSEKQYRLAIRRPVTIVMLFLTLVVFGWKSYRQLPINLMPDMSYPTLTVRTEYEGAAPEDVEKLVTRPLEETLSIVGGLVEISSISSPSLSQIVLEFTWGTDMNSALQDVRDRLDLFEPPKEVTEKPVILRYDPTLDPVMRIAITGPDHEDIADLVAREEAYQRDLTTIREAAERHVKGDLESETGIAQVLVKGGREEEIQILVDAALLKNLGLSLEDIANSLAQQNINLSGGRLREGKTEYLVRTQNEFKTIFEIAGSIIGSPNGQQIRLESVAEVASGKKERETIVHINGREAVALDIFKDGDANTVQVCNELKDILGFERDKPLSERFTKFLAEAQQAQGGIGMSILGTSSKEQLAKSIKSQLAGAKLTLITDQSRFIVGSINEVKNTAFYGGLFALLVLFLFLRELKSTLIIGIAIPISVITAFVPMFMRDISLNIMSLGGLALGVGMLVDNSIVVLESIFRCSEEGDSTKGAADRGTREVASAVTSSTLTTVAVFFPIAFVEGVAGQIFGDLALTVTFSLLASLLVALYLNPMIVSRERLVLVEGREVIWVARAFRESRGRGNGFLKAAVQIVPLGLVYAGQWFKAVTGEILGPTGAKVKAAVQNPGIKTGAVCGVALVFFPFILVLYMLSIALKIIATAVVSVLFAVSLVVMGTLWIALKVFWIAMWTPLTVFDLALNAIRSFYVATLRGALHFGPIILIGAIALAVHAAFTASGLGRELIPPMKQGEFGIRMEAPPGTRLEDTEMLAKRIENVILATPEVDTVSVEIGKEKATASGERGENIAQFNVLLKNPEQMSQRQDLIIETLRKQIAAMSAETITFTLPTLFSFKTAVELQILGDDLEELKRVGNRVLDAIQGIEGLKDAELSVKKGYPEVIIELDRDLLATKGISPIQVAQRLRMEVQGDVATRFSRGGEKIDIRVRSDKRRLSSVLDLRSVSIVDGTPPIPLESVAKITVKDGPSEIRRVDQRQVVIVRANIEGIDLGAISQAIGERLKYVEKPKDYAFQLGGQNRELQTSYSSLQFALLLAIFLVYVVMACQFESLILPALVMFTVPLAFVGVIYALAWYDMNLSVAVFIGGIVLVGIVVNNGIVLVDYINQLRARGRTKREAIVEAGRVRLRPVLMTAVTTVLGLIPMALWAGEGAELRRPLAVTVMAGLSCATILTLIVIPVVFDMFGGRDQRGGTPPLDTS